MMCISGPPCTPGKTVLSSSLAKALVHSTMPPRGPLNVLWVVVVTKSRMRHGTRMHAGGDETRDVRHVDHEERADLWATRANAREVDVAR